MNILRKNGENMGKDRSEQKCGTCLFYKPEKDPAFGECRREPPHPIDEKGNAVWPGVDDRGWCGEWSRTDFT